MQLHVAKHSGFCFGVQRAINMAYSFASDNSTVYTLGELIHNPHVISELEENHIIAIDESELTKLPSKSKVLIRSHGVPQSVLNLCNSLDIDLKDSTCPFVRRIHKIVENAAALDHDVIIVGKSSHPEVIGIMGWVYGNAMVLETTGDAYRLEYSDTPACIVTQTTQTVDVYNEICGIVKTKRPNLTIHNTICDTTTLRQKEARELSSFCDKIIVVGGSNSSNTQNLAAICLERCKNTYSIECASQLLLEKIHPSDIIGVVAGASTPQQLIREVVTVMSELEKATTESAEVETATVQNDVNGTAVEANHVEETVEAAQGDKSANTATEKDATTSAAANEPVNDADASDDFAEAFEKTMVKIRNGQVLSGTIVQIVDGEVCVNIGYKSDGFIPRNEFSSDPDVNPCDVVKVGDKIDVEVLKVNDGEGNVLLSRKSVEGNKLWEDLLSDIETNEKIFEAIGKEVVKGGIIAIMEGVRAFVPASHVNTKYVENLSEYVGQPMRLSVIEVDKARKRIVASQKNVLIKELELAKKERWSSVEVGSKVNGVVRRITDFGAFVDIGGVDGLVHVTDVAWGRVKHPSDILKINQEIEVLVLSVDTEKERISLGYKQLQPKPWTMAADKYPTSSIVEGKVVRIVPFGAFVALEPTIDGLIHISQVSARRIAKVEDELKVGDIVRCKVLEVNPEAKRISLSRKEILLEEDPELAEQIAAERAEKDRQYAERQEQRTQERQQRTAKSTERSSSAVSSASTSLNEAAKPERTNERRPRRAESGDYDLPPVQSTTTSLADLFQGFKLEDGAAAVGDNTEPEQTPKKKAAVKKTTAKKEAIDGPVEVESEEKSKRTRKKTEPALEESVIDAGTETQSDND